MNRPDSSRYRCLEGTLFTLEPPAGQWSITLRLESVRDLGLRTDGAGTTPCYSLCFSQQGAQSSHAPQGTYRLRHDALGEQDLFVVPLGRSGTTAMLYEVIFN